MSSLFTLFFGLNLRQFLVLSVLGSACFLFSSCQNEQEAAVSSLEQLRYPNTIDGFLLAAEAGDLPAIELFLKAGMEVGVADSKGNTALMRAAAGGQSDLVKSFLEQGADLEAVNHDGRTALLFAAESGRVETVRTLLSSGANLEAADREGWTALKLAAYNGKAEAIELLVGKVKQETLDQALLVACFKGNTNVIGQLLNHGAYINTRSPESLTPLMIAAQAGNENAVRFLLKNQANPYALDDSEKTAAILAEEAGHESLRDLLLDPASVLAASTGSEEAEELLLVEDNPMLAGAAISETLIELNGGEEFKRDESLFFGRDSSNESADDESLLERKQKPGPRLASINGKTIGSVPASTVTAEPEKLESRTESGSSPKKSPAEEFQGQSSEKSEVLVDVVRQLRMKTFREQALPVLLKGVESESGTAQVRVLSSTNQEPVPVQEGEVIPGTTLKIASMDSKFISSKMGKGELVDVSSIMVEDTRSGAKHLLVKNVPGRSSETYATLVMPGSALEYVVKSGDVFHAATAESGEQDYEVLDIRPTQVVIRNVSSQEVVTVNRDGIAMR